MGCEIIKQASLITAEEAGDGTTTATILAKAIIDSGMEAMKNKSANYTDFNRGMQMAVDYICSKLDKQAQKVDLNNIENVATISANNDEQLGGKIAEAFKKAGEHGVVLMEKSETSDTYVKLTEGFELEKGYTSDVFVTDKETNKAEYKDALVLISNVKIERLSQVEPFAEYAITNGHRALVVVADVEDAVGASLAMNKVNGVLKSLIIPPTHFGIRRKDILNDLAISTGGILIDEETGDSFDYFQLNGDDIQQIQTLERIGETLGVAPKVIADKYKTVFFNQMNDETAAHVKALKVNLENEKTEQEKTYLKERIAKISSSVAVVKVGAASVPEQKEKADRVDDAIHAVRAALKEGVVAGGGVALKDITHQPIFEISEKAVRAGFHSVIDAILEPMKIILRNGDVEYKGEDYIEPNVGMNIKTGEIGDMMKMKIIDPVRVTKSALRNGVSAASTLLSTSTTIVNLRRV
jgi:chaperonin GroEL